MRLSPSLWLPSRYESKEALVLFVVCFVRSSIKMTPVAFAESLILIARIRRLVFLRVSLRVSEDTDMVRESKLRNRANYE